MEFSLVFDAPRSELSGFTSHTATLIWENACGNDCAERFYRRDHVGLMRDVLSFIKDKGHQIVSMDVRELERRRFIIFHTQ